MSMSDFQVLQRGTEGTANGLPVGGPYEAEGSMNVLVGDIWILAGQSNMEGVGDLRDLETPSPFVHSFQSREEWAVAEEPLHWLGESPRFVHHHLWGRTETPPNPDPRDPNREKGSGLGLAFGKEYYALTGVPVGLIPSAHGGTSMEQWSPAWKERGGASLYGATLERFKAVGGRVKGILWYQGESDAYPQAAAPYQERMADLISAFRSDFSQPDLPFYFVQLGCFVTEPTEDGISGWNSIRESQRVLAQKIPNTDMISAIDLELDDAIHIGVHGLKRLGRRLAGAACGRRTPDLHTVTKEGMHTLRVIFDGVCESLQSAGRPAGFTIRDRQGIELPLIYKTTLEGNAVLLHLGDWPATHSQELCLWYGYGLSPYCNVTDAADQAIPAFGPIPLRGL